ncbi:MAG: DMT family transporter [Candidatus Pacebacteria bacterium]|nr:DMT family transporter [Candidatus Paceibacterota bacterium]
MDTQNQRKGEVFMIFEVLLWAFFPVVTVLSYVKLQSMVVLLWSTTFSALFFLAIVAYRKTWVEFKNPLLWKYSALAGFFIGVVYYGLFFTGLAHTSPGNASLIAEFEVFTAFLFFNVFKQERMSFGHKLGSIFMVMGACVVLLPNVSQINTGDFLVLLSTFAPPVGNYFMQKARKISSSYSILFIRTLVAIPFLFLLAKMLHAGTIAFDIKSSLFFLAVNGILIFGLSKILWLEAIHYISVVKANALGSSGPIFTLLLSYIFLHQAPTLWQLTAVVPMILGVLLLTDQVSFFRGKI